MISRQYISESTLILSFAILTGLVSCENSDTSPGAEGSPCYQNGTCNAGLTCLSGYCVKVPQSDGGHRDGLIVDARSPDGPGLDARKGDGHLTDFAQVDKGIMDVHTPLDQTKPDALLVENTFQLCTDKKDNDGDGKIDCDDPDCKMFIICQPDSGILPDKTAPKPDAASIENTYQLCTDKKDNDGDGKTDCDDPDCKVFAHCMPDAAILPDKTAPKPDAPLVENTYQLCTDKKDNDGDGKTDCDDSDCKVFSHCLPDAAVLPDKAAPKPDAPLVENTYQLCTDKKDNDGDGKTDCDDPDCKVFSHCLPDAAILPDKTAPKPDAALVENTYQLCTDKKDNDGDGKTDCDDPDCKVFIHCKPDASVPDVYVAPDAGSGNVAPSTGILCTWYAQGTAKLNPMFGQYEINTDDGSIYEKSSKKWLRSKGSPGQTVNGIYYNVRTISSSAPEIGVFVVDSLNLVGGSIRVRGKRALAIVAKGEISISGVIDGSGGLNACTSTYTYNTCGGPGGYDGSTKNQDGLGPSYGQGNQAWASGAGGGGNGGNGGNGAGAKPGKGGKMLGLVKGLLFGGSGGGGGDYSFSEGGGGGGAIQIVSSTAIYIKGGGINVSGAGAVSYLAGGAGGGAGGTVLLEAPKVTIATGAVVSANGGGGAGADSGKDGEDGSHSCIQAKGGAGSSSTGSHGGKGGAGTTISGENGIQGGSTYYGGGGGGSAGRIVIYTTSGKATLGTGCVVSPASGTPAFTQGTAGKCNP